MSYPHWFYKDPAQVVDSIRNHRRKREKRGQQSQTTATMTKQERAAYAKRQLEKLFGDTNGGNEDV